MAVTEYELIYGISTIVFIVISVFIGVKITLKYKDSRNFVFISVGLAWILLTSSWWGSAASFMYAVFNLTIVDFWYLFLSNFFVPLALIAWFYSYLTLVHETKIKLMKYIFIIFLVYEVIFLILLIIDTAYIGEILGVAYWKGSIFTMLFQLSSLLVAAITGIHFGTQIRKQEGKTFKTRGIFIIYAFASFLVLGLLDAIVTLDSLSLVIIRIMFVVCGVAYYFGFFYSKENN